MALPWTRQTGFLQPRSLAGEAAINKSNYRGMGILYRKHTGWEGLPVDWLGAGSLLWASTFEIDLAEEAASAEEERGAGRLRVPREGPIGRMSSRDQSSTQGLWSLRQAGIYTTSKEASMFPIICPWVAEYAWWGKEGGWRDKKTTLWCSLVWDRWGFSFESYGQALMDFKGIYSLYFYNF